MAFNEKGLTRITPLPEEEASFLRDIWKSLTMEFNKNLLITSTPHS